MRYAALAQLPACRRYWSHTKTSDEIMKTIISLSAPAELETESLVAIALNQADPSQTEKNKDAKPQIKLATGDSAVQSVTADLFSSGEVSGKPFEINLLHKPAGLKAKRLLLISGGAAKKINGYDLRRHACYAPPNLKSARSR